MEQRTIEESIVDFITLSLRAVAADPAHGFSLPQDVSVELEIPKEHAHGDLATNVAMRLAKHARQNPLALATRLKAHLEQALLSSPLHTTIASVEVKPPGFINFFISPACLHETMNRIRTTADTFGKSAIGAGTAVQLEFVSANPTGPLTIAHGRQAAIGDALANILTFAGYRVTREYYNNDEGNQMDMLGKSIQARYREIVGVPHAFPADGYKGGYVYDIAEALRKERGDALAQTEDIAPFREFGLAWIHADIAKDLKDFGVIFDVWYSQKALRQSGKIEAAVAMLREKGYIYESEGAVWFKSTAFGDDKDRVIVKSDGKMTYLTPDIAYHLDKYNRGFKRIIDIWGPDHHGYIPRMKAAVQALGYPVESISVLIVQLATLYRGGQVVSMSTRAGEFVTLREVMDEVGKDVARFCFLMRRISSHLDFDLDVVKQQSMENPVYYIQYAHARIWSIMEYGKDNPAASAFDASRLTAPEEIALMRMMRQFPLIVTSSARALEPYVIVQYLQDLAAAFHSFYTQHRVVGDDPALTTSRLALVDCVRIVLANGLHLLGVSLPKKM